MNEQQARASRARASDDVHCALHVHGAMREAVRMAVRSGVRLPALRRLLVALYEGELRALAEGAPARLPDAEGTTAGDPAGHKRTTDAAIGRRPGYRVVSDHGEAGAVALRTRRQRKGGAR